MYKSMVRGAVANIPLAISAVTYGGVLGVLSGQKGVSWAEMSAMNVFMFAGSAQFVMVDMWKEPLSVWAVSVAVFVVNLRYLLIGASLRPVFEGYPLPAKAIFMHFVADENWAVTIAEQRKNGTTPFFLFGGGLLLLCAWSFGTLTGNLLGGFISQPEKYGLDFAFTAVFAALALSLWRGQVDLCGWFAAALLAFVSERYLPGKWYIVIGGVGGALVPAMVELFKNSKDASGLNDSGELPGGVS
ncbi:MAG: AzlC family ABC transporter permease [Desulforhopalus sp.]